MKTKNVWQAVRTWEDFCFACFDLFWCLLVYCTDCLIHIQLTAPVWNMQDCHTTCSCNFHCSKMSILRASCSMGFLGCPGFRQLNIHKCTYLINESDCSN